MQGDSGGPVIYSKNSTKQYSLIGVTSALYLGWSRLLFSYEVMLLRTLLGSCVLF